MVWSHTRWVIALVQNVKLGLSVSKYPRKPMSTDHFLIDLDPTIAILVGTGGPFPAIFGLLYFSPESFHKPIFRGV